MTLIDYHDVDELKNRNEEKVWMAIEAYLESHPDQCRCRDCILDAAAISLNNMTPRYHVYSFHENSQKDDSAILEEANQAVKKAFKQVDKRPHHF